MTEKESKERLNEILEEYQEIINIKDKVEREIEMSMYFEEMPFKEIQTVLQLLEQKDNKINKVIDKLKEVQEEFINYCPDCVDLANNILKILEE